jgi:hypothetical protein
MLSMFYNILAASALLDPECITKKKLIQVAEIRFLKAAMGTNY